MRPQPHVRRSDEKRFAPGQSHEPGKSDPRRSVSWLTGHRAMRAFPGGPPRWRAFPVAAEPLPVPPARRARRLQLQGQLQICTERAHCIPGTGAKLDGSSKGAITRRGI